MEAPITVSDSVSSSSDNKNLNGTVAAATETDESVIAVETESQHATGTDGNDTADTGDVEAVAFDEEEDGCDSGYLVLRSGNTQAQQQSQQQQQQQRKVPNGCAICLGPYEVGEVVVWSSNAACQHAFHEECMVDWLCKMLIQSQNRDSTPCPCCRQEFTDLATYRKKEKIANATPRVTFNPQLVRL
jgi:hypothetical protein